MSGAPPGRRELRPPAATSPVNPTTTPVSIAAEVSGTPNQRWNSGTVKVFTEYDAMFDPMPANTIHHTVGTDRIRRTGRSAGPAAVTGPDSAATRCGSFTKKKASASSSPGTAANRNGARQPPNASAMAPMVKYASTRPSGSPSCMRPVARARFCAG